MKIYSIVCCINDTEYTRDTLISLGMSNNIDEFDVAAIYAETDSMPALEFFGFLDDLPHRVDIHIFEQARKHLYNFVFALKEFKGKVGDYDYFVWIENDNLFNPDWFEQIIRAERQAINDGYDVGLIAPNNIPHPKYRAKEKGVYTIKRVMPGPCFVMSADTVRHICPNALLGARRKFMADHNLCNQIGRTGKTNICLTKSMVQHIGRDRSTYTKSDGNWERRGSGGLGFVPDGKVLDIWKRHNNGN